MSIEWCPTCNKIKWPNHKCAPLWAVEIIDYGEFEVRAIDVEGAAEAAVEKHDWDCAEFTDESNAVEVIVIDGDQSKKFSVYGEMLPEYHATEFPDWCPLPDKEIE